MKCYPRMSTMRRYAAASVLGTTLAFGGCNLGEFTSTSTVTLSGREVLTFLVRSWVLTPIESVIDTGIDKLFDQIEGDEDGE